jgi:glycine/D-amino acid oxidase-like deaminating enzyme
MHVVVVGAGVFGLWTAHHVHAAGMRVTLVDAHGVANSRSSSGDESRILRCGYGADAIYTRMARESLEAWRSLDRRRPAGEPALLHPCGVLWLGGSDDPYMAATIRTLEMHACEARVLDRSGLHRHVPHLDAADVDRALLEPSCGAVMARRALGALASELAASGIAALTGRAQPPGRGRVDSVRLNDGVVLEADVLVYACGAWLPALFPDVLGDRIRPTRQVVVYFGTPAGDSRFGPASTPAWVDFPAGVYGIPDLDGRGLKVGIDTHGPPFDPETGDRTVDRRSVETARRWLRRRLPDMAAAPVLESRVCQYENTSTGDFLIDRHPEHDNVLIVGGGSGHGFKHGPAVGAYVARLLTGGGPLEPRFALASKGTLAARQVF